MRFVLLPACVALIAACGVDPSISEAPPTPIAPAAEQGSKVQMNDVTVIYPLASSQGEFDAYLQAAAVGVDGALLPKDVFLSASGFPETPPNTPPLAGGGPPMPYSTLRVVAVRLDPCFANIGPIVNPASCQNQLRVVFQSLSFSSDMGTMAVDGAVHAFYALTRQELVSAVSALIAARQASGAGSDQGPLAAHPLLVKQGLSGTFGAAVAKVVTQYAGSTRFSRFTFFRSSNADANWNFAGFDITRGSATAMVIPTLPAGTTGVLFFAGFGAGLAGGFTPATTANDDMQLLANQSNAKAASQSAQQAALDAAFAIENPNMHSPNTIDCASCHAANPAKVLTAQAALGLSLEGNQNAFKPDATLAAADLAQTAPIVNQVPLNLHMLSYNGTHLAIAPRVINETAAVVTYLNKISNGQ